jgi:hypothetical protein
MSIEDPTFGCGTFLPGVGPGNFPDFPLSHVESAGGTGGPTGPTVTVVDRPPGGPVPPGGGGGPGGGVGPPGPGGPGSPGPGGGPSTGGTANKCRCRLDGSPTVIAYPFTGGPGICNGTEYRVTWKQTCGTVPLGQDQHNPSSEEGVTLWLAWRMSDTSFTYTDAEITDGSPGDGSIGGEDCKTGGTCGGDCPDIVAVYTKTPVDCEDGSDSQCYCVYESEPENISVLDGQGPNGAASNCKRYQARFKGACTPLTEDPGGYESQINPWATANAQGPYTLNINSTSNPCGGSTPCGGDCPDVLVTWFQCEGYNQSQGAPGGPVIPGGGIVGGDEQTSPTISQGGVIVIGGPRVTVVDKLSGESFGGVSAIDLGSATSGIIDIGDGGVYDDFTQTTYGCTIPGYDNYDPNAMVDNGTCRKEGCMDPTANNYDPMVTHDNGSCIYVNVDSALTGDTIKAPNLPTTFERIIKVDDEQTGSGDTVFTRPSQYDNTFVFRVDQLSLLDVTDPNVQTLTPIFWNPQSTINVSETIVYADGSDPEVSLEQAVTSTVYNENDDLGNTIQYNYQSPGWFPGDPLKVILNSSTGQVTLYNIAGSFLDGKSPAALRLVYTNPTFAGGGTKTITVPIETRKRTIDTGDLPNPDDGGPLGLIVGKGQTSKTSQTKDSLVNDARQEGVINLDDPSLVNKILKKKPTGLQDSDVGFMIDATRGTFIRNETGHTDIFADRIDSNIAYVLRNKKNSGDWDSTKAAGVTPNAVYNSLRPDVQQLVNQIRNYDGTPITEIQIYNMIGTRILDGSVGRITLKYLQNLAESSKKRVPTTILRSSNSTVNEVAAAVLIDSNKFTLDPSKATGRMMNILPNWKTLATDIDQYLPVTIGGAEKRFYINDDNTFIASPLGENLKIKDGNYIDITRGGKTQRLFTKSEIDHAFILPETARQKALSLLGADTGRTLEVSAPGSLSSIEFDYSLSAPRQNFYVLSAVLSSINTIPSPVGSFLLKDSTLQYDLVDTSTTAGLDELNAYIKYKVNHRVFILDDEDLIFDYLDNTGKITMKQTDILFDSPKTNKSTPLLTRQIPWYILVYPTNRRDYNIFNDKSQFVSIESDGAITRSLKCTTTIIPEFNKGQTNKFVRIETDGKDAVDVLGNSNTQTRITKITPTDTVFTTGYKEGDKFVAADAYTRTRKKTGFRLVKEIITELNTNYLLGLNAGGKIVTEFDVFSRLHLSQFTMLSKLENFTTIRDAIRNGLVEGVRVIPPVSHSDADISYRRTLLLQRKLDAPDDTFVPIKGTRNRQALIPPTTEGGASFAPVPSPREPTTPT